MGFFRGFGLNYGNAPGDASGNINYLPITELDINELYVEARDAGQVIGEVVTEHAKSIAEVLTREKTGQLFEAISYAVREVLRNAAEHSQSKTVRYCGQYWPTKNRVQIAILDSGIGVTASLANNPHLETKNDADALKLATMPGISGKMFEGVEIRPYDAWQNSGYGLYMIYRMCRRAGSLFMTSNDATLQVISDTHSATSMTTLPGTSIRIQFDTRKLDDLSAQLKRYAAEGKEQAKMLRGAQTVNASAASLMLHREEE